jgi:DNA-binding transcriptional MocR family regulator
MRINFSYPTKDEIVEGVKRLSFVVKKYLTENKKNILTK